VVAVPPGVASTEDKVQTSISEQWLVCQDGVTVYRNTRFFRWSNGRDGLLSSELHGHVRPSGHVRSGGRRLLPRHAAAYGFQFQASILSCFHGAAHGFAYERRDCDPALLDLEDYGSSRWQLGLRCDSCIGWVPRHRLQWTLGTRIPD